jgi:hypothetical protein
LGLGAEKTRKAKPSGAVICTFALCLLVGFFFLVAGLQEVYAFSLGEKNGRRKALRGYNGRKKGLDNAQ